MGLFDKVKGISSTNLTPAEGFTGIALCAVAADGVITPEEVQGLSTSLGRTRIFQQLGPRQVKASFEKVHRVAREQGTEALLKLCSEAIPRELRPTAFAIAVDLVFADGEVTGSEQKYVVHIQNTLGVDAPTAEKIVDVMAIKNKA